jgi:hypothetical protein
MGSSSGDGRQLNCDTINVQCKEWEVDRKYCIGRVLERVGSWLTRVTQDDYICRRRCPGTRSSAVTYVRGT